MQLFLPESRNRSAGKRKVYAPFDGVCENLFDTLHAIGITSDNGIEMLIHVGLETVALKGEPFKAHTGNGEHFKKGALLLEFDIDAIQKPDARFRLR